MCLTQASTLTRPLTPVLLPLTLALRAQQVTRIGHFKSDLYTKKKLLHCVNCSCFYLLGSFDVDSTLDFDFDHIAAVGGLPPDITSGADLLAVSGLGTGDGSVDIDLPGAPQSKM